ncbi:MAG: hypothetical protein ACKVT1_19535, partial [Dehalococcoidia bacterium]
MGLGLKERVWTTRVEANARETPLGIPSGQQLAQRSGPYLSEPVILHIVEERTTRVPIEVLRIDKHENALHTEHPESKTPPALERAAGRIDEIMRRPSCAVKYIIEKRCPGSITE